ncbi:MAG: hypothetical protein JSS86_06525 [Cyanobacteria bacterium SZAS LIN-2]|nr:hypothetical protein [Cyanobacteria bacterium SZAS LIN-2]
MDLKFTVEGQSAQPGGRADGNNLMVCANCSFPLERLSGAQSKVLCPRCNTWLDIDPNCGGSCLACHKTLKAEATSACVETTLVNSKEKGENFSESRVRKNQRTFFSRFAAIAGKARQYLSGKLIL